jgi:hypothetical protein
VTNKYQYDLGGKRYTQRALVLGQLQLLIDVLKECAIPVGASVLQIVEALGDRLPRALAVVLVPEGVAIKDRDLEAEISDIINNMDITTAVGVIEDFFSCNPLYSIFDRLIGLQNAFKQRKRDSVPEGTPPRREPGLTDSACSSAEETSPKESASSGAIP